MEDETTAGHVLTVWLDARAALKIGAVTMVTLWLGLAGGLWLWLARDPFNRVGYADLACPWRWSDIRDRRGQGYLAAGLDALHRGRINDALLKLTQGFSRHPDAAAARLTAARFYASAGYYAGVREVMMPQFARSRPSSEFIRFLVEAAAANDDHATMLVVCDRVLADATQTSDERGWLGEKKAAALLALNQPQAALRALDEAGRGHSLVWRRLHVMALCDAGRAVEAVAEIRIWPQADLPEGFRLQVLADTNRRAGRFAEMAAALEELERLHPTEPVVWVNAISQYTQAGWRDAAGKALEDGLRCIDAEPAKVEQLRAAAVAAGDAALVSRCVENARELGRSTVVPLLDLAITQLRSGDAAAAERTFGLCLAEQRHRSLHRGVLSDLAADLNPRLRGTPLGADETEELPAQTQDWLRTLLLTLADPEDARAVPLIGVLEQGHFTRATYACSAEVLARARRWPALAEVMRLGLARFPGSTELTRWSGQAAREIAAMELPAPVVLAAEPEGPDFARMGQGDFFNLLDLATTQRDWMQADRLIARVRRARPSWLDEAESELAWREVCCALEEGEIERAALRMSFRLRDCRAEAGRGLELVREFRDRKKNDWARLLATRLVDAVPDFPAARNLLDELEAAEKAAAEKVRGAVASAPGARPAETVEGDPH